MTTREPDNGPRGSESASHGARTKAADQGSAAALPHERATSVEGLERIHAPGRKSNRAVGRFFWNVEQVIKEHDEKH